MYGVPMLDKANNSNGTASVLGSALRQRRKALRLTQRDLAELVGVTRQTIGRLERGDPSIALGTALDVADVLNVSILGDDADT